MGYSFVLTHINDPVAYIHNQKGGINRNKVKSNANKKLADTNNKPENIGLF